MSDLLKKLKFAAKSAATATKNVASSIIEGKELLVSENVKNTRMAICHQCPEFIKSTGQCGVCLCICTLKTSLKTESCPKKHWNIDDLPS